MRKNIVLMASCLVLANSMARAQVDLTCGRSDAAARQLLLSPNISGEKS